ncbi:hypothetical protein MLD38_038159 [Melastoma candidum]|uniref:Uncharacterized protein n=1 Tax=Melastoma candidum TaxID=119954 RepID=A0ACB9KY32_9MYRT|nr:hypothetical protein MLD38_038159 [Melastoma candidum]
MRTIGFGVSYPPPLPPEVDVPRSYELGDVVPLFANTIYSEGRPCETQLYFDFPLCPPGEPIRHGNPSFLEIISGDCWKNSLYKLEFKVETVSKVLCERNLKKDEVIKLRNAVRNGYVYDLFTEDGLRVKLNLGRIVTNDCKANETRSLDPPRYFLSTHIKFRGYISDGQLVGIEVDEMEDNPVVDITELKELNVTFTYDFLWWNDKLEGGGAPGLSRSKVEADVVVWRWSEFLLWPYFYWYLSMLTALVSGVALYVRGYLRRSMSPYITLLGAFLGAGIHLLILMVSFFYRMRNVVFQPCPFRGTSFFIVNFHVFASLVSGAASVLFCRRHATNEWKECIFQAWLFLHAPVVTILLFNRGVYDITATVKLVKLAEDVKIETLLKFFLGSALFQLFAGWIINTWVTRSGEVLPVVLRDDTPPNRMSWPSVIYQVHLFFIPSITTWFFVNMDLVFSSIWGFKVCGIWANLVLFLLILILLTAAAAALSTHHLISEGNSKWWWRHILHGGATAAVLFLVGINFLANANWNDAMERILSIGYLAGMCYGIFVVLGTVSYWSSSIVSRSQMTHPHSN